MDGEDEWTFRAVCIDQGHCKKRMNTGNLIIYEGK